MMKMMMIQMMITMTKPYDDGYHFDDDNDHQNNRYNAESTAPGAGAAPLLSGQVQA